MSNFIFTPRIEDISDQTLNLERASVRIKSEAPLGTLLRSIPSDNQDFQRQLRGLHGLVPETPSVGQILGDFLPPEKSTARTIKEEATDNIMDPATLAMTAKISSKVSKTARKTKAIQGRDTNVVDLTGTDDLSDHHTSGEASRGRKRKHDQHGDANSRPSNHTVSRSTLPTTTTVLPLTAQQELAIDQLLVPQDHLAEIQTAYERSQKLLPSHVMTWSALKDYASQHPIALLSADNIRHAQTQLYHKLINPLPPSLSLAHVTNLRIPNTRASSGTRSRHQAAKLPRLQKEESQLADTNHLPEDVDQSKIASLYNRLRRSQRKQTPCGSKNRNQLAVIDLDSTMNQSTAATEVAIGVTDLQIQRLMEPLNICPDLLPSDAPENYPHLVQIWDAALVNLPRERHGHLNLIDTIASIIYKYDEKNQHVIRAFLDIDKVKHFFFLFKSRNNKSHSWSVEREGRHITIGIERNERAPNVSTESPSAGQYDLTIRYQLQSFSFIDPNTVQGPTANPLPTFWVPYGRSILPIQPDLETFLYNTPPNRGADDHRRYNHTATHVTAPSDTLSATQSLPTASTDCIPSDQLSILARFLQITTFTSLTIDTEFQVCWGHKVRYDAVLGRIRALFTNALRGAITQAKKRQAGEYNRPASSDNQSGNSSIGRPGNGTSSGHLKENEQGGTAQKKKANPSRKTRRTTAQNSADDSDSEYVENE